MNLENLISKGKKAVTKVLCAGLAASTLLLTACPPMATPKTPTIPTPSKPANVQILTEQEAAKISNVGNSSLTFSQSVNYSEGDIIVSGITNSTPEGLLREVTGVSTNGRTIYTETASLEEAIEDVTFATQRKLSRTDVRSFSSMKGVFELVSSTPLVDFNLNIGISNESAGGIAINGNIEFDSDLVLEIDIRNHHLDKLSFKNVIHEESNLQLTGLNFLGNSVHKEFSLAHYDFTPFAVLLPTVPPFPLVITPKLKVVAGIDGGVSPIMVGANQSVDSELGLKYENGSWNVIHDYTPSYSFTPVTFASALNVKAFVGPQVDFLLYGVAGPYADVFGYLNLEASRTNGSLNLYGGLEAILGVSMKIFSKTVFDFSTNLVDFNWLLKSWGATEPDTREKILFVSGRDGNAEIYRMNTDGTNHENLTNNSSQDYDPSWSPNKDKIVFVSGRDGNPEIYTMNADGSSITRLTYSASNSYNNIDRFPDWSPNGQEIVFYSERNGNREIWLMNSNGTNQRKLNLPFGTHGHPRWSHDGTQIVFTSTLGGGGDFEIYKVSIANPSNPIQLTANSYVDIEPVWSPDGSKIAFSSDRYHNGDGYYVYIMDANGNNQRTISDTSVGTDQKQPSWSPDGTKIAYTLGDYTPWTQLYSMNSSDGSNKMPFSESSGYELPKDDHPAWSK